MRTPRFAIVISRYNTAVTDGLLEGALATFKESGHPVAAADIVDAPGAFELPLIAKALAETERYAGIVTLGCVIKGDTAHFEFISLGVATGIQNASLETGVPIAFGVLTTYTDEQAELRSKPGNENKGREAALACLGSAKTLASVRKVRRS